MADVTPSRTGQVSRKTNETAISVSVNVDGTGVSKIATGVGFFDHMLDQLSRHSLIDMEIKAEGDLHVDDHHTVEDTGIAIGQALAKALGDRRGITRYASIDLAMDETMTRAAVDVSGRPFLVWNVTFTSPKIGTFDTELVRNSSRRRPACRHHAACAEHLRRQQPSCRRDLLQVRRPRAPHGNRNRSAPGGTRPLDQGDARLSRPVSGLKTMASYLIMTPPGAPADDERARFIADGFSWAAFFFPGPWLIVKRAWLIGIFFPFCSSCCFLRQRCPAASAQRCSSIWRSVSSCRSKDRFSSPASSPHATGRFVRSFRHAISRRPKKSITRMPSRPPVRDMRLPCRPTGPPRDGRALLPGSASLNPMESADAGRHH